MPTIEISMTIETDREEDIPAAIDAMADELQGNIMWEYTE